MVCQQVKCKGERDLSQVAYLEVYDTLMNAAKCRNDETMIMRIRGEDLVAIEAKYHKVVIEDIQLPHHHLSPLVVRKVSRLSMTARF